MIMRIATLAILIFAFASCDEYSDYTDVGDLKYKLDSIAILPSDISECSGFAVVNDQLVIINDGSHDATLHYFDLDSLTSTAITIEGAYNNDWEGVTVADGEILIADTGNNNGKRQMLRIYHIDAISHELSDITKFTYPGQTFEESYDHDFDTEAIAYIDGEVCLFTKNRSNTKTNLYTAPLYSSEMILRDSIEVPWRVTDACYHPATGSTLLLCNQKVDGVHMSAIELVRLDVESNFVHIGSIPLLIHDKLEAITVKEKNTFYLGSERESGGFGLLYEIDIVGL